MFQFKLSFVQETKIVTCFPKGKLELSAHWLSISYIELVEPIRRIVKMVLILSKMD